MNATEQFVYEVCKKTFLSLWSYANPLGKKDKELCDILIVSEPNIIIISVKDIKITNSGDEDVDIKRWTKKAIDKSVSQLYGAKRWLHYAKYVIKSDGTRGLQLPPRLERNYYRLSVSIGGEGRVPILSGDYGQGNVHIFDESAFSIILRELDTISDFVAYLVAIESFGESGGQFWINSGGQEDLLGYYLTRNRQFDEASLVIVDDDIWNNFISSFEYKSRSLADEVSYIWDNLIEMITEEIPELTKSYIRLKDIELVVRIMSQESRFSRRVLGKHFSEFVGSKKFRSRILPSATQSTVIYVILNSYDEKPEDVMKELDIRCFIARGLSPITKKVIGIAMYQSEFKQGFAVGLLYLDKPQWTDIDEKRKIISQEKFSFFVDMIQTNVSHDEFPKN